MEWFRAHPYTYAVCAAGALLIIGAFIVQRQSAVPVSSQTTAWGGGTPLTPISARSPEGTAQNQTNIMQQVQSAAPYTYIPPAVLGGASTSASTDQTDSFDFNAFMAELGQDTASAPKTSTNPSNPSLSSAYAFIPGGLVSTTTPQNQRTKVQQDLYDYGNELGSYIQSFEQQHPGEAQILTDQVQDRTDAGKIAAVQALGQGLQNVGESILRMDTVPPQMASVHAALAKSYIDIGTKLALVPQAQRDSDFVAAIQAYDASADIFTKNYVAVAQLFGAYGVTFASDDPGSVFTFTQMGL